MKDFTESIVEDNLLAWLQDLSYTVLHGPAIAPRKPCVERDNYAQVVLTRRLCQSHSGRVPTEVMR